MQIEFSWHLFSSALELCVSPAILPRLVLSLLLWRLCFCGISRFVFTVTMENEGSLLSPSYRWKYMVSLGKLMTELGNEPVIQFWMSAPPPGELWGCRAEPCLFLAQEVRAVSACCPQFWPFRHAIGNVSKTCAHPMVCVFCVRSGRIPQPLQVLMFALLETFTSTYCFNFMETLEQFETSVQGHCRPFFSVFGI